MKKTTKDSQNLKEEAEQKLPSNSTKQSNTSFASRPATDAEIRAHRAINSEAHMEFEAFEHKAIGNRAMKELLEWYNNSEAPIGTPKNNIFQILENENFYNSTSHEFRLTALDKTKFKLSAGEIVALAGDFFGVIGESGPICTGETLDERLKRFQAAYETLAQLKNSDDVKMVEQLKKEIDKEYCAMLTGVLKGVYPSEAIKEFEAVEKAEGRERTFIFSTIMSHESFISKLPILWAAQSEYVKLLRYNFDHFGEDAKLAFKTGFDSAFNQMKLAKKERNPSKKASYIFESLTQLLFACHFLTDLFASGHIRTPRRALHEYVRRISSWYIPSLRCDYLSGMLVHEMHDEDNEQGLNVKSKKHETHWKAYGDRCHFNPNNTDNYERVVETMVEAFKELINAYHDKNLNVTPKYSYEAFIPSHVDCPNHEPMFEVVPNVSPETISLRGDLVEPPSDKRVIDWDPAKLWNKLKENHLGKIPGANESLVENSKLSNVEQKRLWMEFFKDIPAPPEKTSDTIQPEINNNLTRIPSHKDLEYQK